MQFLDYYGFATITMILYFWLAKNMFAFVQEWWVPVFLGCLFILAVLFIIALRPFTNTSRLVSMLKEFKDMEPEDGKHS